MDRPEPAVEPGGPYRERLEAKAIQLAEVVDVAFTANPFRALNHRYVIAASARTGSNLLCERLRAHGAVVQELFHTTRIKKALAAQRLNSLQGYCEKMVKRYGADGTFGVKGSFDVLAPFALAGEIPDHIADWRFVYLTRGDLIKQAISHFVAEKSGSWRSVKEGVPLEDSDYDGTRVARLVERHKRGNALWEDLFSVHRIDPFRVTYEQLAADPPGAAAHVAAFLGLHGEAIAKKSNPPLVKQATSLNARWEARFREESAE
ncbi:MAG: hypothetical protein H0X27_03950 [Caulobacteraceae bacterium]|nr:hypothetical protein [Caulobacteraceae bacterium]